MDDDDHDADDHEYNPRVVVSWQQGKQQRRDKYLAEAKKVDHDHVDARGLERAKPQRRQDRNRLHYQHTNNLPVWTSPGTSHDTRLDELE